MFFNDQDLGISPSLVSTRTRFYLLSFTFKILWGGMGCVWHMCMNVLGVGEMSN